MNVNCLLLVVISSLLMSCGGGSNSDELATVDPQVTVSSVSEDSSDLEGVWVKACSLQTHPDLTVSPFYTIATMTFSGNNFSTSIDRYSNAGCIDTQPNSTTIDGRFAIEDDVGISNTYGIIFTFGNPDNSSYFRDEYNIYSIESDMLYFGLNTSQHSGDTKNSRPAELDYMREFIRS